MTKHSKRIRARSQGSHIAPVKRLTTSYNSEVYVIIVINKWSRLFQETPATRAIRSNTKYQ